MSLRRFLALIFVVGACGLGAELLLLGHFEDVWQSLPLAFLAVSTAALLWDAARHTAWSMRIFGTTAVLLVFGGILGVGLHYDSNVEFEREMYPDLAGFRLMKEALSGAIPALAPGALIQLGLVGLAYAYQEKNR